MALADASRRIFTRKSLDSDPLLSSTVRATESTTPLNSLSGYARMRTAARCPAFSPPTSDSSTSATANICPRSATSMITVPGLFIVPVTTSSPTSALRRVTIPSIGEVMVV